MPHYVNNLSMFPLSYEQYSGYFRSLVILFIFCLFPLSALAQTIDYQEEPTLEEIAAWQRIAGLDYTGAVMAFEALVEKRPESRHARLGLAIVTLNRPPKSNSRCDWVADILKKLIEEDAQDEVGLLAAYQLARLYHVHYYPKDFDEARRRYIALHDAHPDHELGQHALLRLATIDLYSQWPLPDADGVISGWEAREAEFSDPVIRRNFLKKLGDAILWFDLSPKRAVRWYEEANALGFSRFDLRTLMMLKVYNISVEENLPALTRTVAERYLKEFPRDTWSEFMREKLTELDEQGK